MTISRLLVAKMYPLLHDGETNVDWDLDRWENDGGRNLDKAC